MISAPPPKSTGNPDVALCLTYYVFPWKDDQPVLVTMVGSTDFFFPVFSSAEKLRAFLLRAKVDFATIKQILDPGEFLDSIPQEILVVVDPWYTLEGKVRYRQVKR